MDFPHGSPASIRSTPGGRKPPSSAHRFPPRPHSPQKSVAGLSVQSTSASVPPSPARRGSSGGVFGGLGGVVGGATGSLTSQLAATATTPRRSAFSKFFTQLKSLIVDATSIEPSSDVAPGLDHCCKNSRCHFGLPIHLPEQPSSPIALGGSGGSLSSSSASSETSSSNLIPQASSRLIVYRDCDRRGRKILFDSDHVTSDFVYMKPSDPKLLKQLGEYVFGCVPLASTSSSLASNLSLDNHQMPTASLGHMRFCKWKVDGKYEKPDKTLYIWSKMFEMGAYGSNRSTKQCSSATPTEYSSSPSSSSEQQGMSSGCESGGGYSSSGKTYSLPLFNQRLSSSPNNSVSSFPQTRSLPGRIDNYKTNLALVWIFNQEGSESSSENPVKIPFPYLSPLVEQLMLNPLSFITQKCYHNSDHFVTSLKNVSSSLNYDLKDFLENHHVVNLSMVKPPLPDMVNCKLVCRFLELYLVNLDSCLVLSLKKWTEVKAILYFLKMVLITNVCKCGLMDSRRDSLVETGTDAAVTATTPTMKETKPSFPSTQQHELDCVDSGIELEGGGYSSASSSSTRMSHGVSSSSRSRRKWSVVSEEGSDLGLGGGESSQDELDYSIGGGGCGGLVSFHLGDVDLDQSESKLALGEVDLGRLKRRGAGDERRSSIESSTSGDILGASSDSEYPPEERESNRPPLEIKLSLSDSKLKDACSAKYTPCYHCNGTYITEHSKFNPFYNCQVITKPGQPVTYDMEYVSFIKIIELYGTGSVRSFNLPDPENSKATPQSTGSSNTSSTLTLSSTTSSEETLSSSGADATNDLSKKIKGFVDGYIQLAKMTNDSAKLNNFVSFQMEEMKEGTYTLRI